MRFGLAGEGEKCVAKNEIQERRVSVTIRKKEFHAGAEFHAGERAPRRTEQREEEDSKHGREGLEKRRFAQECTCAYAPCTKLQLSPSWPTAMVPPRGGGSDVSAQRAVDSRDRACSGPALQSWCGAFAAR